jgi:hypothetical protein
LEGSEKAAMVLRSIADYETLRTWNAKARL